MASREGGTGALSSAALRRRQRDRLALNMPPLTVIYPGTFDPFTRGHEDLVRRAARLFDRVIVGIADSESKHPFFTTAERIEMTREVLAPFANVEVEGFSTLLMDFVHAMKARVVLRGLRAISDFE